VVREVRGSEPPSQQQHDVFHIGHRLATAHCCDNRTLELACSADCSDSHLACQLAVPFGCQRLGEDVGDHQLGADVW
jgi:hypothetical protein